MPTRGPKSNSDQTPIWRVSGGALAPSLQTLGEQRLSLPAARCQSRCPCPVTVRVGSRPGPLAMALSTSRAGMPHSVLLVCTPRPPRPEPLAGMSRQLLSGRALGGPLGAEWPCQLASTPDEVPAAAGQPGSEKMTAKCSDLLPVERPWQNLKFSHGPGQSPWLSQLAERLRVGNASRTVDLRHTPGPCQPP